MKEKKYGRIVNVASVASGQQGFGAAMAAHYTASKGGVTALTEAMADELAAHGILVNALAPGFIETEMTAPFMKQEKVLQGFLSRIPLGRVGTAEEMANVVLFLVSKENAYMTGSMVVADGGWLAA
jgi:2-deoxy-D-gluconate 3-dehydrogenase